MYVASVNRELAVLRRVLNVSMEWKLIDRVPKVKMLPGEKPREFVLTHEQERHNLETAPQPLRDVALLILDTGLRPSEALSLLKSDVRLNPINGAEFGLLHVREGKTKNAKRHLALTERVKSMLESRINSNESPYVFPGKKEDGPFLISSLDHQHAKLRSKLQLPKEAVIHSLRHTMLTRLGESGVDVFTIMKIAGHSSVSVSEKYVHPSSESMERAFKRLQEFNKKAVEELPEIHENSQAATISATSE